MTTVKVTTTGSTTTLRAPYNPDLPPEARTIGGRWNGSAWVFDARDEERVRELARKIYGTDGTYTKTVTVRIRPENYVGNIHTKDFWLFGRKIAERYGRDADVQLGEGVILISGGFPPYGGSIRRPDLNPDSGTVLEVRDVPADHPDLNTHRDDIEIVDEGPATVDVDALRAERERLLARIAEIDALLDTI